MTLKNEQPSKEILEAKGVVAFMEKRPAKFEGR